VLGGFKVLGLHLLHYSTYQKKTGEIKFLATKQSCKTNERRIKRDEKTESAQYKKIERKVGM
jgi:hypothetical protein